MRGKTICISSTAQCPTPWRQSYSNEIYLKVGVERFAHFSCSRESNFEKCGFRTDKSEAQVQSCSETLLSRQWVPCGGRWYKFPEHNLLKTIGIRLGTRKIQTQRMKPSHIVSFYMTVLSNYVESRRVGGTGSITTLSLSLNFSLPWNMIFQGV